MASDRFPADPAGARAARRFARQALWELGEVAEVAELLVSELASNAVRHATAPFTVEVQEGDPVRVVVSGAVATMSPDAVPDDDEDPTARGLMILDALADRWGVQPTSSGAQVWFELRNDDVR